MRSDTHENCADCSESYHTCTGWPAGSEFACTEYRRLGDVGVNGQTGQEIRPSRMGGSTEPKSKPAPVKMDDNPKRAQKERAPGPKTFIDDNGIRRCECGKPIPKKKRCCNVCREQRHKQGVQRMRKQNKRGHGIAPEGPQEAQETPRILGAALPRHGSA